MPLVPPKQLKLTTKGDIVASNGTQGVAVAIGADGQVLKAKSSASAGVEWGAAGSGGKWTLVEERVVATDSQVEDFSTGIDGNVDKAYMIEARLRNGSGGATKYHLRLNGAAIAGIRQFLEAVSTSVTGGTDSVIDLSTATADLQRVIFVWDIPFASTLASFGRIVHARDTPFSFNRLRTTSIRITTPGSGVNITSIGVGAADADGILTNSIIRLWKQSA